MRYVFTIISNDVDVTINARNSKSEPVHEAHELVSWVDIDIDAYRKAHDMTTMRINVSVPRYLKVMGDDAGINFSGVLQQALRERFGV